MENTAVSRDGLRAEPGVGTARRVLWLRALAIPGPGLLVLTGAALTGTPVALMQLLVIITGLAAMNLWTWWRLRSSPRFTDRQFFAQMVFDAFALTGILYYSGGASNPFAFFFLLPLTITATALPRRYTWTMAALTVGCYTMLLVMRRPLPRFVPGEEQQVLDLHASGMWIGFVLIAVLIAHYVAGIGETLRDRDRRLARAREGALRDERLVALGTLAAGAAHELSTPLGTMALLTDEIGADYPEQRFPDLHRQLQLLEGQITRCKDALVLMASAASAEHAEGRPPEPLDSYLTRLVDQVRSLRPGAGIRLDVDGTDPRRPAMATQHTLDQALTNLLNNAVDVSPRAVEVRGAWTADRIRVQVLDRGPGPGEMQRHAAGASAPRRGLGVGLLIAESVISQLGGTLEFAARTGGGTRATVWLPRARVAA